MSGTLRTYAKKRRFSRTPEPGPKAPARKKRKKPIFVIHKHDATRLHYDLRLEIGGALASWAIPKGPSFDPKVHRLAVETEDHPLAYATFEGRIPSGEYGGGDSVLWDRGSWETEPPGQAEAMRRKGHIALQLDGEKLHGRWHLVRTRTAGRKQQWLFFKGKDEFADTSHDIVSERPESVLTGRRITRGPVRVSARRASHPAPMDLLLRVWPPMLATPVPPDEIEKRSDASNWSFEVKYDGFRGLAALSAGKCTLQSRNGLDLSQRFPTILKALLSMDVAEAVLDGELVAVDSSEAGSFEALQQSSSKLRYFVFDLLWLDGEDLRSRPLEDRRDLLRGLLTSTGRPIQLSEQIEASTWKAALDLAHQRGLEGILAKRRHSIYEGRRSTQWIKLKLQRSQEVVIAGYTPIENGKAAIGALLLSVSNGRGGYTYAGKVGTGYSDKDRAQLWRELERMRIDLPALVDAPRMKDARWVPPRLVAQVRATEWTRDGRLRHPVFAGLREDKRPEECVREPL